ncbi:hypothetical protein D3C75_1191640 [compost metagenome]
MAWPTLSTKASATLRSTYTRSAQLQTWPVLITREATMAFTARSRSASASTIAGALPPSSRLSLVMFGAAAAMIRAPVATLPVKLTRSTPAWLDSP